MDVRVRVRLGEWEAVAVAVRLPVGLKLGVREGVKEALRVPVGEKVLVAQGPDTAVSTEMAAIVALSAVPVKSRFNIPSLTATWKLRS